MTNVLPEISPLTTPGLVLTTEYGNEPPITAKVFGAPAAIAKEDGAVVNNGTADAVTLIVSLGLPLASVTITWAVPPTVLATALIVNLEPVTEAVTMAGLELVAV